MPKIAIKTEGMDSKLRNLYESIELKMITGNINSSMKFLFPKQYPEYSQIMKLS